jgi:hypothetical protein
MIDVEAITYEKATELLALADSTAEWLLTNQKYANHDHWQNGDGWTGPMISSDDSTYDDAQAYLQRVFVTEDVWMEIVERHTAGVLGEEPIWRVVPKTEPGQPQLDPAEYDDATKQQIQELTTNLGAWYKNRNVQNVLQRATQQMLWAKRGPLRMYIPAGMRQGDSIPAGTFADMLKLIYLESPSVTQATVHTDPDTKEQIGIYQYNGGEDADEPYCEMVYVRFPTDVKFIPESAGAAPLTVIKIIDDGDAAIGEVEQDIGGHIMMHEMIADQLMMTESMTQNQRKINKAATVESTNLDQAGFTARLFMNAQMPGVWEEDADGIQTFKPLPMYVGPGTATYVTGIVTEDADGAETISTPQYIRDEPVSPQAFGMTKDGARLYMLSKAKQVYVALSESPYASGESRLRARGDYESSLTPTAIQVAIALRWILQTTIKLAASLAGDPLMYEGYTISAEPVIDIGSTTPFERQVELQSYQSGAQSLQTTMRRLAVRDPEAELQRILFERSLGITPKAMMGEDQAQSENTTTNPGAQTSGGPTGGSPNTG